MYSSPFMVGLRNVARALGINRLIAALRSRREYEDRFSAALLTAIRQGDTVWDIGANLGLYTTRFADRAGSNGMVVAFEPVPACFEQLKEHCSGRPNIIAENMAAGAIGGTLPMALESDALAATHRIEESAFPGKAPDTIEVTVIAIDEYAKEHTDRFPNVMKIDVEGFEGAVLKGMTTTLGDPRLRCVGIEIHFHRLAQRGETHVPKTMELTLRNAGFAVRWTDASHIVANR